MTPKLRTATMRDIPAIARIERASFGDAWTSGMLADHLRQHETDTFIVAEDGTGAVIAYAIARTIQDSSELLNIAVHQDHRRAGIGALLLDSAMQYSRDLGAEEMWLEVRESNAAGRALYASRGFSAQGRRRAYYQLPREDAWVLSADLARMQPRHKSLKRVVPSFPSSSADAVVSSATKLTRQETI